MERLLTDATKLSGVEYDISNLDDVYSAIHIVQEELGITGTTAKEASETIQGSFSAMKSAFKNVMGNMAIGEDVGPALQALTDTVSVFVKGNLLPILKNIGSAIIQILPQIIEIGIDLILSLIDGMIQALPELIPTVVDGIILIVEKIIEYLPQLITAGIQIITALIQGLIQAIPVLIAQIPTVLGALVSAIADNLPMILEAGWNLLIEILNGIIQAIPQIPGFILEVVGSIINSIVSTNWFKVGADILSGIGSGIIGSVGSWAKNVGSSIIGGIKGFFGINSPSTLFKDEVGKNLSLGVAEGIKDNIKPVTNAMGSLAQATAGNYNIGSSLNLPRVQAGNEKINDNKYNINIYNPKPEKSSDSVRRTLMKQSYGLT